MDQDIDLCLRTLMRGLTQDNLAEMYEGYKALYRIGGRVIPQIRDVVFKANYSNVKYSAEIRYVSGLVSLIHDIDESEGIKVANQLKRGGCDSAIVHVLDSICAFTLADYDRYHVCGVKIFAHKNLFARQKIKARLEQWLKNVPSEHLNEIERIYILREEDLESRGNYRPILYRINLVWDNPCSKWNPISWMNNYFIEKTLYHEIGHHVHRHTFGQDPEQEREAKKYSERIMANSTHTLAKVGRIISKMVKSLHRNKQDSGDI